MRAWVAYTEIGRSMGMTNKGRKVTERPKRATFKEDPTRTNEQEAK
jgi:hypothetical protein